MTNNSQIEFPEVLYGRFSSLRGRVKTEAKRWADEYRRNKTFPTPVTTNIPARTIIYTRDSSDLVRETPQWRLYFTRILAGAINEELNWERYEVTNADFESFTLQFPWGALDAALEHVVPNSIANVSRRINAVLLHWGSLNSLSYVDKDIKPIDLMRLMSNHFDDLLDMWLDQRGGDIQSDLRGALDAMLSSTPGQTLEKVLAILQKHIRTNKRIRNAERLADPEWLKSRLLRLEDSTYLNLTTGYVPDALRVLYILDDS